jgi:dipeptidyl aminopeptidase/acylaminoacyl peptidase
LVYTTESFQRFPDLLLSDLSFASSKQISTANPQQSDYSWGTAELMTWTSLDGDELEGLLFKPENFDPNRKYPMIVNFYERSSTELHDHIYPKPERSTINYALYASNGYVIFNPDVHYRIGYPGESCYNSVIPGVTKLIDAGFIDMDRIGVQGHSWGGYQIAYLVTKTDMFAAAEAGAPVPNMISAYGGIRWWTGLSRMFQYEHTQSRIGGTLWEYPLRFIENSPIFFVDKINTPLLIMHNDADGHVPWYQGIELFVAMRRLGKPSWMLNYPGEPHWPLKRQNQVDFDIRMMQYFDHFLKDAAEPRWMREGVPAVDKEVELGYELEE